MVRKHLFMYNYTEIDSRLQTGIQCFESYHARFVMCSTVEIIFSGTEKQTRDRLVRVTDSFESFFSESVNAGHIA